MPKKRVTIVYIDGNKCIYLYVCVCVKKLSNTFERSTIGNDSD